MMRVPAIRRQSTTARLVRAGPALALVGLLAACEGGYTEATSPCVGSGAPRLSVLAAPGAGDGLSLATRRGGDPCAFTALGAP